MGFINQYSLRYYYYDESTSKVQHKNLYLPNINVLSQKYNATNHFTTSLFWCQMNRKPRRRQVGDNNSATAFFWCSTGRNNAMKNLFH